MKSKDIKLPSDRKFGFFFTTVFLISSIYFYFENFYLIFKFSTALTLTFLILTLTKSKILNYLNKLWMRLGYLLSKVISPIVLGVIFFGIFTPVSLLMKLFKRDELRIKLKKRDTFWKNKDNSKKEGIVFKQQF